MTIRFSWNEPNKTSRKPSDRGWCSVLPQQHPDRYTSDWDWCGCPTVGNYLDYTGCHYDEVKAGTPIHASAYVFRCSPRGSTSVNIGCKWCATYDEARTFIEETVTEYLAKLTALAA